MHKIICASFALLLAASLAPAQADLADEVFYQFMPISWRDGNSDTNRYGDFLGMTDSLDYLDSLGITAIWMNPIFPSPAYHGYQHGPADQINPRFGTEQEFIDFLTAANARGIKVFIDFVVYGISHDSIWYQDAQGNPASQYDPWLAFENGANTSFLGAVYNTWNGDSVGFIHWNHNEPEPTQLVTDWAIKWLDPNQDGDFSDGVAGYRLDHVWQNYPNGPNGWGYNLNDFWIPWKNALTAVNPNVITFAEQADWGINGTALFPAFDATMTKPFEFAVRDAINAENATKLYEQMARLFVELPIDNSGTFLTIIGDHDVDRLTSVIGSSLNHAKLGAAILFTQPFTPMMYYGDEIGMLGFKANYGSDANDIPFREPMKWNATDGPPHSNYWTLNSQAYSNRYSQNNDGRSIEEQDLDPNSLLNTYRNLATLRAANIALRRGGYSPIPNSDPAVWTFLRHHNNQTLIVAINLDNAAANTDLDMSAFDLPLGPTTPQDIESGALLSDITDANKSSYPISIPAWGWKIYEADLEPPAAPVSLADGVNIPTDFPAALATQTNPTTAGNNINELNQLFAAQSQDTLRLAITANLENNGNAVAIFLDTRPGGQTQLDTSNSPAPPSGLSDLTGTEFDAGFQPDEMYFINTFAGSIFVDQLTLPTGSPATKTYRGQGGTNTASGLLAGGSNPNDLQVAMNNTNTQGVTSSSAANADTATTGFELSIPLADLNPDPGHTLSVLAVLLFPSGHISNQTLPPLPNSSDAGNSPNFASISGDQFAPIPDAPLPCNGDANADGTVDVNDISYVLFRLGNTGAPGTVDGDANADGIVDVNDLSYVLFRLGPC